MTLTEVKKELKVFDKFKFFEEDHHYECNGKRVGISVTRLIEEYSNPFDQQAIAEKVAIRDNKSVSKVLEEWEYKNKFACDKGSTCHEYAQSIWSGEEYNELLFDGSIEYLTAVNKIQSQAINFWKDFKNKFTHIQDEQLVGSEEYNICSAVDHLFLDKDGNVWLIDYKTNSILKGYNDDEKNRRYTKKMLIPLQNIKDDSLNHYYLQLSIYKYLIEKYTNIKIYKTMIVYMSENIEKYELIETPYLMKEVELILENRRERKMGKCIPVLIIGKSGSGKSTSLRNLKKENYSLVNVLNKDLPFKEGRNIQGLATKDYELVKKFIKETPKDIIVVDDFGYIMTNEFVSKATETGYTKFSVIAQKFYNFVEYIKTLDGDKRVYLMMHEEKSESGDIAPKTCGKMLDNQICVEGLFSILLRCIFDGKEHKFKTATDGLDVCKTPIGMFEDELIDNDLKLVDDTICEYYEINKKEEKKEGEDK
jgi:hypothetical protein